MIGIAIFYLIIVGIVGGLYTLVARYLKRRNPNFRRRVERTRTPGRTMLIAAMIHLVVFLFASSVEQFCMGNADISTFLFLFPFTGIPIYLIWVLLVRGKRIGQVQVRYR